MKKIIIAAIVLLLLLAVAVALVVLRTPEEASGPIEAIPLELVTEAVPATALTEAPTPDNGDNAPAATAAATAVPTAAGTVVIFQISPADSQVRFELDEDLRGSRITVVGTTNQLAGEMAVNLADLAQTQVGVIQINARTLATDNNFRNRAIQNEILDTGANEFITFTPTAVNGLPPSATVGDTLTFTIEGDLTIRDITRPATFTVEATVISETQISGTASTLITRGDYGLIIPNVPNVANVEEEVELYITFVANAS
jgi:polyisoprenoid-binding protein YceI